MMLARVCTHNRSPSSAARRAARCGYRRRRIRPRASASSWFYANLIPSPPSSVANARRYRRAYVLIPASDGDLPVAQQFERARATAGGPKWNGHQLDSSVNAPPGTRPVPRRAIRRRTRPFRHVARSRARLPDLWLPVHRSAHPPCAHRCAPTRRDHVGRASTVSMPRARGDPAFWRRPNNSGRAPRRVAPARAASRTHRRRARPPAHPVWGRQD